MGDVHHPTTRPGHRLPHAWVRGPAGQLSTHDLIGRGHFTLLLGAKPDAWTGVVDMLTGTAGFDIIVHQPEAVDTRWGEICGIGPDGAILVRPDGHVAWRAQSECASAELAGALSSILAIDTAQAGTA